MNHISYIIFAHDFLYFNVLCSFGAWVISCSKYEVTNSLLDNWFPLFCKFMWGTVQADSVLSVPWRNSDLELFLNFQKFHFNLVYYESDQKKNFTLHVEKIHIEKLDKSLKAHQVFLHSCNFKRKTMPLKIIIFKIIFPVLSIFLVFF